MTTRALKSRPTVLREGVCPSCGFDEQSLIVLQREPREVFAALHPGAAGRRLDLPGQLELLGARRDALLRGLGGGARVLEETWYLAGTPPAAALGAARGAATAVIQAPCCAAARVSLQLRAIGDSGAGAGAGERSTNGAGAAESLWRDPAGHRHLRLAGILPRSPGAAFERQCREVFERAQEALAARRASWREVVRTWFYLRHMQRDYASFNAVRRRYFTEAGVTLHPASTGIGGAPLGAGDDLSLSLYAVVPGATAPWRAIMQSETFNEAPEYGAFFSRGLELESGRARTLLVSGTAAVDRAGASVGRGSLEVQARRMLENVEGLLRRAGAGLADVVQATSYLKDRGDLARYREVLAPSGLFKAPHLVVEAEVCRPELLCEIECVAFAPARPESAPGARGR